MKIKWSLLLILPLLVILNTGCDKFLSVQPAGVLPEDKQFEDVQGFRDAMYGVYATMAKPELYGGNLSFGFADKIGQMLVNPNSERVDNEIRKYEYLNQNVRPIIDQIWTGQYKVISYLNLILSHLEKTPLQHQDLQLIRGEAYGLRAFLHFDIVRLFAEDYLKNKTAKGIPYSTTFDLQNKELLSLQKAYEQIIDDLKRAEQLLTEDNRIIYESTLKKNSIYQESRHVHFNKWAVKATLARVYYHMGNADEAIKYAREVIKNSGEVKLLKHTELEKMRRFPGGTETIFGLNTTYINKVVSEMFLKALGSGEAVEGRRDLEDLYENKTFTATNIDKRFDLFYRKGKTSSIYGFSRLLKSNEEAASKPLTGLQIIRLPEMYYILAEMLYDTNKTEAEKAINEVRSSRGLEALKPEKSATKDAFVAELLRERMREMPGDGQVFFALKRYNRAFKGFDGKQIEPSSNIFVLPWPQNELDFGNA